MFEGSLVTQIKPTITRRHYIRPQANLLAMDKFPGAIHEQKFGSTCNQGQDIAVAGIAGNLCNLRMLAQEVAIGIEYSQIIIIAPHQNHIIPDNRGLGENASGIPFVEIAAVLMPDLKASIGVGNQQILGSIFAESYR